MIDLDRVLVDELDALAPFEPARGDWADVRRRTHSSGRTRRRLGYAAAAFATVVALSTAANAAFGWKVSPFWAWVNTYPPGRTGPIVTVFSGRDWNLVAWRSTKGICTSYSSPGVAGSGCTRLPRVPVALDSFGPISLTRSRILGNVAAVVVRVEVRVPGGQSFTARLSRRLPELGTTRRFFVAEAPVAITVGRHEIPFLLVAYDARGRVIGRTR